MIIILLQSMENYIQLPMNLTDIDEKTRLNLMYLYALLRSHIKDSTLTAAISQEKLAGQTGCSVDTIQRYIDTLHKLDFITDIRKIPINGGYYYNEYKFPFLKEYGIVLPSLLTASNLQSSDKGLLILLKLNCQCGTNIIEFNSISALAKQLNIRRQTLNEKLKKLAEYKYIAIRKGWLNLAQKYFPLYLKDTEFNKAYKGIYDYCILNNCIPPFKVYDKRFKTDKDLRLLFDTSQGYKNLSGSNALLQKIYDKCPNLPDRITFDYLKKALLNLDKVEKTEFETIIL